MGVFGGEVCFRAFGAVKERAVEVEDDEDGVGGRVRQKGGGG